MKSTVKRVFLVVVVVCAANIAAGFVWSSRNSCLRSHTEPYLVPADPYSGDDSGGVICDWYKTDPNRNPWSLHNEFRAIRSTLVR